MSRIGRNDPCPCGSGKKYKKCCGTAAKPDYFEINRDIAYRGKIGLKRQEFCINYIEEKRKDLVLVRQQQVEKIKELGKVITCLKGCHFCCSAYVQATIQECEAIVYYLYQNNDILQAFLQKYPAWREEVRRKGDLFKQSNRFRQIDAPNAQVIMQRLDNENRNYDQQGTLCPFLQDGLCSIYEVRPYMCAALLAISPPEWCKSNSATKPELYRAYPGQKMIDPYFYYGKFGSPVISFMPLAIYEILKNGTYYFSLVPGLENLDKEFCTDPEVLPVLREYGVLKYRIQTQD